VEAWGKRLLKEGVEESGLKKTIWYNHFEVMGSGGWEQALGNF